MKELNELKELILSNADCIVFNMNDIFSEATSDVEEVDIDDLVQIWPIYMKYSYDAIIAYTSIKRDAHPLKELRTDEFKKAKRAILKLMEK